MGDRNDRIPTLAHLILQADRGIPRMFPPQLCDQGMSALLTLLCYIACNSLLHKSQEIFHNGKYKYVYNTCPIIYFL